MNGLDFYDITPQSERILNKKCLLTKKLIQINANVRKKLQNVLHATNTQVNTLYQLSTALNEFNALDEKLFSCLYDENHKNYVSRKKSDEFGSRFAAEASRIGAATELKPENFNTSKVPADQETSESSETPDSQSSQDSKNQKNQAQNLASSQPHHLSSEFLLTKQTINEIKNFIDFSMNECQSLSMNYQALLETFPVDSHEQEYNKLINLYNKYKSTRDFSDALLKKHQEQTFNDLENMNSSLQMVQDYADCKQQEHMAGVGVYNHLTVFSHKYRPSLNLPLVEIFSQFPNFSVMNNIVSNGDAGATEENNSKQTEKLNIYHWFWRGRKRFGLKKSKTN